MIGIANRSRKVVLGETCLVNIQSKKCKYVFIAKDASDNTKKKYIDKCEFYRIPYNQDFSSDYLSSAIGSYNRMVLGIVDDGFAKKIKELVGKKV